MMGLFCVRANRRSLTEIDELANVETLRNRVFVGMCQISVPVFHVVVIGELTHLLEAPCKIVGHTFPIEMVLRVGREKRCPCRYV